jgi:hypothetical protein
MNHRRDVAQGEAERPQDYRDLVRLVNTLQALEVRGPAHEMIRTSLLAKLTRAAQDPLTGLAGTGEPGRQRTL